MSSPVFSHIMGTLALIGAMVIIIAVFLAVQFMAMLEIQNVRLSEVAETTAREIVELVSVYTLGGGNLTYMYLTVPQTIGGQAYSIRIEGTSEGVIVVRVKLQIYEQVRVIVTPNFGERPVKVVANDEVIGGIKVSREILLPAPERLSSGVGVRGKPAIVVFRDGENIYVGLAIIYNQG
ncbi:MAG: hypothetical protein J7J67_02625 [Thermoproteales archaeon]|nr:hypothetical protein [Thermoproteales archaeon]